MPRFVFPSLYIFVFLYALLISLKWDYLFLFIPIDSNIETINYSGYLTFSIIFALFFLSGFIILFKKYLYIDGVYKSQLRCVLWGTGLSFVLGLLFNLLPGFFNKFFVFYWVGPMFTLINAGVVANMIFSKIKK